MFVTRSVFARPASSVLRRRALRGRPAALGYSAAASAGILWGFSQLMSRGLLDRGFSPLELAFVRSALGIAALALLLAVIEPRSLRVGARDLAALALFGVVTAGAFPYFLFAAQERASIAIVVALLYTAPPLATLLAWIFLRERVTRATRAAVGLSLVGVLLVSGVLQLGTGARVSAAGVGFGVASGVCFAIFMVGGRHLVQRSSASTVIFYSTAAGTVALAAVDLLWDRTLTDLPELTATVALLVAGVVLVPTLGARLLYAWSMKTIGTAPASVLSTLEPVTATIAALVVFDEVPTGVEAVGIAVIIAGAIVVRLDLGREQDEHGEV